MPYDTAIPVLADGPRVRVVFVGPDVDRKVEEEAPEGANVEAWARGVLARLNAPRSKTEIQVGVPLDLTLAPPPDPPPATPFELYQHDLRLVVQDAQEIAAGVYDKDDPVAQAHLAAARSSRAAYLASIKG